MLGRIVADGSVALFVFGVLPPVKLVSSVLARLEKIVDAVRIEAGARCSYHLIIEAPIQTVPPQPKRIGPVAAVSFDLRQF